LARTRDKTIPDPGPSAFTTEVQAKSHHGGRRRFLWAAAVAVLGLVALVLFGPDEQAVKERFEYYGAPGEMQIMPEISIVEGNQSLQQLPRSLQVQPPPANIEVELEEPDDNGTVEIPPKNIQEPNQVDVASEFPREDAEMSEDQQVEMAMPLQSNADYFLLTHVPLEYPLGVSETERRIPVITVTVNVFVGIDGVVTDVWLNSTNGSRLFVEATIKALKQWKFGWRVPQEKGRILVITHNFKSPYFTPNPGNR